MNARHNTILTFTMLMLFACVAGSATAQTSASGSAGPNLNVPPAQGPIDVDFVSGTGPGMWMLQVDLIVDPSGGPMGKHFLSPQQTSGQPILIDAQQPFPQVLWENFLNLPVPTTPGVSIVDWHEEIHTPGWQWVLPSDAHFPGLFPATESLITKNGDPWPWELIPMDTDDPTKLWVKFPPIEPNNVLDVHKALLWVGTPGNQIWGDGLDDAGNIVDEQFIDVWEYPTITPEPATAGLLCLGLVGLVWMRRR